uniref:Uncharacterized protein n=1 Tax=Anguilla anguilla TaxID=7936 RepID=A0A0E9Y2P9_ANGAN
MTQYIFKNPEYCLKKYLVRPVKHLLIIL